ncbi:dethiobiotin synthase [Anaerotignum sp.]|uniref:dethiobiotin synthase n=1 Tax=Anaerotignum sp. TaxID=2039241 RepID=UPI0028AC0F9D|nr:dethiobiotin synthase [Anaerotignum sp.]
MAKGIFVTATGTDIGKTYISALLVKVMRKQGLNCGYYKAALSGANNIEESDAGFVNEFAQIGQEKETLLSYLFKTPVSPHLASKIESNPISLKKVQADYEMVCRHFDYVVTEGSGGIVCPLRWEPEEKVMLEDVIKTLSLSCLVVAGAGLGTINATVLTTEYLKHRQIRILGIIMNNYTGSEIELDNIKMIEALTEIPVIACVKDGDLNLNIPLDTLETIFDDKGVLE